MIEQNKAMQAAFPGLLAGLVSGQLQSWGLLEMIPLFPAQASDRTRFVAPLEHLKLVRVPTYGTIVLQNTAKQGTLIAPMHIGFFQPGAQNHATSRVLVLDDGKEVTVQDAFCIQASQGGLLQAAQQRFIVLPLDLRAEALAEKGNKGYSRLWGSIEKMTRKHGIARGGHLERFLRPNFQRLMRFRYALEMLPEQVGAAYFVAGNLVGVEVAPNATYWQDIGPILTIYCYGAAALLAERHRLQAQRRAVDLDALLDLADLQRRLSEVRKQELDERIDIVRALSLLSWPQSKNGLGIVDLHQDEWHGQLVGEKGELLYLSLFRSTIV
jgi:hypothetical protein